MWHGKTTEEILQAFYSVYNDQGYGFLEKVYENAMRIELESLGCQVETQKTIQVSYRGQAVGEYFADLVVDGVVIVELKAAESIHPEHEAQISNYLRATQIEIGLLSLL